MARPPRHPLAELVGWCLAIGVAAGVLLGGLISAWVIFGVPPLPPR